LEPYLHSLPYSQWPGITLPLSQYQVSHYRFLQLNVKMSHDWFFQHCFQVIIYMVLLHSLNYAVRALHNPRMNHFHVRWVPCLTLSRLIVSIHNDMLLWPWLIASGLYWRIIISLQRFNVAVRRTRSLLLSWATHICSNLINFGDSLQVWHVNLGCWTL
jgi:hypothetical protein